MTRPCWLTCHCDLPCDHAERVAESRATRDDVPESDRGQRADELAGRDERVADERWGWAG
jgi:hypothetical protein